MRYSWLAFVFFAWATITSAAAPAPENDEAEMRTLEYRFYEHVEFPTRIRRLDAEIKLTAARIKSLEKLLAEYQSFQKFSVGNPLTLTVEETKLQLLEAKLRLEGLREERSLLVRYKDDQRRLFELRSK